MVPCIYIYIYIILIKRPHICIEIGPRVVGTGSQVGVQAVAALRKEDVPSLPHWRAGSDRSGSSSTDCCAWGERLIGFPCVPLGVLELP